MANILSQTEKKKILLEYRLRLGVTVVFAVAALVLANIILLAPSYFLVFTKYNFIQDHVVKLERAQGGADQEREMNNRIRDLNKKVSLFDRAGNENVQTPLPTILKIIGMKDSTIKIDAVTYEKTLDRERVVVRGVADDRDGLALFLETLKKEPSFTKVDLPIGSYVKSADIEFSLAVEHSFKPETPQKK